IALDPTKAIYFNNYGAAQYSLGRCADAMLSFERALELKPRYADALANRGMTKASLGREEEALADYRNALETQPGHRDAMKRLASLLQSLGRSAEAIELYEAATSTSRGWHLLADFGSLLESAGRPQAAIDAHRKAVAIRPGEAGVHLHLGAVYQNLNRADEAREQFGIASRLSPENPLLRARSIATCQPVFGDAAAIEAYDEELTHKLGALCPSAPISLDRNELLVVGTFPGFVFSYHGRNQRLLKEQFAGMYEAYFRDLPRATGSGNRDRLRVGILVTRWHERMFLRSMRGIIENLDRNRVEPVVLCSRGVLKTLEESIHHPGLRFAPFGDSLMEAGRQIRATACDVIYYWEIGSDAMNYFLPFARLAPVQCTGWGSTITSGVPAVDYFLSSELIERPGSEGQYSERLWKSRTLFRYQERLPSTAAATPADFGLPEDRHLYVCFQNPLKLHPDFDPLLAGVLEADPLALVVLLGDRNGHIVRLLKERLARRNVAPLAQGATADDYGAGSSCYDLFSYNLPVVTLPGELIVGRVTQACYRKMGVDDLVVHSAEEYVRKAVQVATDREYRYHVTERIAGASDVLFNDLEAVREHERFFADVTRTGG
ncbi:MAG: tetratricopeptide repeat protein, partial [Thermoguttaceae bacterium]